MLPSLQTVSALAFPWADLGLSRNYGRGVGVLVALSLGWTLGRSGGPLPLMDLKTAVSQLKLTPLFCFQPRKWRLRVRFALRGPSPCLGEAFSQRGF